MMAKRSTAQRLGRVLERVTQQSGRLPETPAYGSWLLGRVSESQARRRVRIQLILTVFIVGANLIGHRRDDAAVDRRVPHPQHFQRRTTVDHLRRHARLLRRRVGTRYIFDHPSDHRRLAMGDRGTRTDPGRRTRHLCSSVLAGPRCPRAVGPRDRLADDALRVGRQYLHSDRGLLRQRLRHSGVYRVLSVH